MSLGPNANVDVTVGPVKIFANNEIVWKVRAVEEGKQGLMFGVDGEQISKELAVGEGFRRINATRPGWHFWEILEYPAEEPFRSDSVVQSISISYPKRISKTSGSGWWIWYFFGVSIVSGLIFLPVFKVKI